MNKRTSFWDRRRAAVDAEALTEAREAAVKARAEHESALADTSDEELLATLNLPDPDSLTQGDDFAAFMRTAVPERLRRRALRTLWRSNPILANVDGLVDYGEDFTDSAMVVQNMQTSYQVGQGMLAHIEKLAADAEAQMAALAPGNTADHSVSALTDETDQNTAAHETRNNEDGDWVGTSSTEQMHPEDAADVSPAPRRMRFTFEGDTA